MIQPAAPTPTAIGGLRMPSVPMLGLAVFALPGAVEAIGDATTGSDDRQDEGKDGKLLPVDLPAAMPIDPWAALAAFMPVSVVAPSDRPVAGVSSVVVETTVPIATATPAVAMPAFPTGIVPSVDTPVIATPRPVSLVPADPRPSSRQMAATDQPTMIDGRRTEPAPIEAILSPMPKATIKETVPAVAPSIDQAPTDVRTSVRDPALATEPRSVVNAIASTSAEPAHNYRRVDVSLALPASARAVVVAMPIPVVQTGEYQRPGVVPVPADPMGTAPSSVPMPVTWQMSPMIVARVTPAPVSHMPVVPDTVPASAPDLSPIQEVGRENVQTLPFLPAAPAPAGIVFGAARLASDLADRVADTVVLAMPDGSATPVTGIDRTPVSVVPVMAADGPPLDLADHRWPHAMLDRIEMLRDAVEAVDTRIRVMPDALGAIEVGVRQEGDTLHVRFTADQPQTRALLQEAQPRLAEAAEQRGLRLGQTSIGVGADAGTAGQGQHRPPPAQPSADPRRSNPTVVTATDPVADDDTRIA